MSFRRGFAKRPINSTKQIFDTSSIIAATTNTVLADFGVGVNLSDFNTDTNGLEVPIGAKVASIYFSMFFYSEGGEVATEIPLVDWYFLKDDGSQMQTIGFAATGLPTPGATGSHANKRKILHEEKGLTGGGDASLAGVPMVFKGVIRIPRGMQTWRENDQMLVVGRSNFNTKFCIKAIYKTYM